MREGWKEVLLGEIISIKHGYGFKGEFFIDEPNNNLLITPGNFAIGGGFKSDKIKYYEGPISSDFVLSAGDVIVTMTDLSKQADTLGFSAKIPNDPKNKYLHNQRIGLVSLKNDECDLNFIYWLLRTHSYQRYIAGSSSGATVKHTSPTKIYSAKVNFPKSKEIQQKIASILSHYDNLIENNLKRIKLLEEKAQLTYEEWFVKMRFPGFETAKFDKVSGLPEGWENKEFQFFGQVITGKTPSTRNELFFDGNIPFVKTPDMAGFPYVLDCTQKLSKLGANSQKNKFIPKNSLMISCIGSAGAFALASEDCQTNQQINSIIFHEEYYTFFFYCLAKGLKPILEGLGSNGATMTNVNKGKFEKIEAVCPPTILLLKFHNLIKYNFEIILNLQKQNRLLKEARDILLPRLMSGMIDVEELELGTLQTAQ
jgi:type I restriction enzyme S subunit